MEKTIDFTSNEIVGTVKFGEGCVIHPTCSIIADGGDIIFGNHNIIEEKVVIHNKPVKDASGTPQKRTMIIGDFNLFEMCSAVENSDVGSNNIFQYRSSVSECKVGRACVFGSEVHLSRKALPDGARFFYPNRQRPNDMFDQEKHREVMLGLYEALAAVAPRPRK